jgi:Tol biopolymer transport system component
VPQALDLAIQMARALDAAHRQRIVAPRPETGQRHAHSAVSPDGARVAFIGWDPAGEAIWIRRLDTRDAAPVPGTHGVRSLFWSPDGTTIGFFAGGKLKTLDVAGQKIEILCDAPLAFGGAWGSDGTILFSPDDRSAVHRVDARGGTPVAVTALDAARGDEAHRWPQWMPDGRHFVFMPWRDGATRRTLQLGSIDGTPPRPLFESQSGALVAADHFVYVTDMPSRIRAQRYDPRTLQLSGPSFALLADDNVDYNWMSGNASASVSERTLVYAAGKYRRTRLTWLDRNGRTLETLGEAGALFDPAISPDGTSVAFERHDRVGGASGDIWTLDLSRGGFSRLTSAPGFETTPIWSSDGSQVAFAWDQGPRPAIYTRRASGTGTEDVLVSPEARSFPTDWSRDGRHVLLMLDGSRTRRDIWRYDVQRREATPLLDGPFNESGATFSPDGRWIAYVSDEDQRSQVYVRSFPDGSDRTQISASGGSQPQWRRDGRELFYIDPDNAIMAVAVQASGERLTASAPHPLFTAPVDQRKSIRNQYAAVSHARARARSSPPSPHRGRFQRHRDRSRQYGQAPLLLNDSRDGFDSRAVTRRPGERRVAGDDRRVERLCQGHVHGVVCRDVLPEPPCARQEIEVGMAMKIEVGEIGNGFGRPFRRDVIRAYEASQRLCHFDVHQVRRMELVPIPEQARLDPGAEPCLQQKLEQRGGVNDDHADSRSFRMTTAAGVVKVTRLRVWSRASISSRVGRAARRSSSVSR